MSTSTDRGRASLEERLWRNVEPTGFCWLWTAAVNEAGYGRINRGGRGSKTERAHRVAYELLVGPIPDGFDLDHLCRVRACVNPDHLEVVTKRVNTLRSPIAVTAVRARQTHCKRGHSLEDAYSPPTRPRSRYCRVCKQERHMKTKHPEYVS